MADNLRLSFCTTCKGRLDHLKETLPANLKTLETYPNAEIVILDYDSPDGLEAWIKENFQDHIKSGRLRYAKYQPVEHFYFAHAKNLAHLAATGEVLCNVDADNLLAPGFAEWLNKQFSKDRNSIVRMDVREAIPGRLVHIATGGRRGMARGTGGRVAISRENFLKIRGYDETHQGWGPDDIDFFDRAVQQGMRFVRIPTQLYGNAIAHDDSERFRYCAPEATETTRQHLDNNGILSRFRSAFLPRVASRKPQAINPNGFGDGQITINFESTVSVLKKETAPVQHYTASRGM